MNPSPTTWDDLENKLDEIGLNETGIQKVMTLIKKVVSSQRDELKREIAEEVSKLELPEYPNRTARSHREGYNKALDDVLAILTPNN